MKKMLEELIGKASFIGYQGASPEGARPLTLLFQKIRENTWDKLDFEAAKESLIPSIQLSAAAAVVVFGVYTFGDGVGRPEQPTTAEITGARYEPPYTTQSCSSDGSGNQSCTTNYHPEEFHIRIQIPQTEKPKDIQVTKSEYKELKEAAEKRNVYYQAVYREGRILEATWIDLAPGPVLASQEQILLSRQRPVHDPSEDKPALPKKPEW